jgi:hypothetical protein
MSRHRLSDGSPGSIVRVVYEPRPRLFAGGNPRDRHTGGLGPAVVAVVILALTGGAAALFSLLVFPYASDPCGDPDRHLICTSMGQNLVVSGPLLAATVGLVIGAGSLALRPPYRALGISIGYLVSFGSFFAALIIATAV